MRKNGQLVFALLLVMVLIFSSTPANVIAKSDPGGSTTSGIAGGSWTAGDELDVNQYMTNAPTWLQLLSNGDKLDAGEKSCHPFRGGQFGWIGEIRQYKDGNWIKVPTVNDWVPNKEGSFMSCVEAPSAGIYALFGYYIPPVSNQAPDSPCDSVTWDLDLNADSNFIVDGHVYGVATGTQITMVVDDSVPGGLEGISSDTVGAGGVYFDATAIEFGGQTSVTVTYTESSNSCTHTQTYTFGPF